MALTCANFKLVSELKKPTDRPIARRVASSRLKIQLGIPKESSLTISGTAVHKKGFRGFRGVQSLKIHIFHCRSTVDDSLVKNRRRRRRRRRRRSRRLRRGGRGRARTRERRGKSNSSFYILSDMMNEKSCILILICSCAFSVAVITVHLHYVYNLVAVMVPYGAADTSLQN